VHFGLRRAPRLGEQGPFRRSGLAQRRKQPAVRQGDARTRIGQRRDSQVGRGQPDAGRRRALRRSGMFCCGDRSRVHSLCTGRWPTKAQGFATTQVGKHGVGKPQDDGVRRRQGFRVLQTRANTQTATSARSPTDSTGASTSPTWSCSSSWTSVGPRPNLSEPSGMLDFASKQVEA